MQNKRPMQEFVIDLLKENIPATYRYHNYEHTLYVLEITLQIAHQEGCSQKEIELLTVAALWHDTGYINTYDGHEAAGCLLAKEYLPGYGFSVEDIVIICGMIMATKVPQLPNNKTEAILADADLAYLGTDTAAEKATDLFNELQSLNPSLTTAAWDKMQVAFLSSHHYFTDYCKEKYEPGKQAYLKELMGATS